MADYTTTIGGYVILAVVASAVYFLHQKKQKPRSAVAQKSTKPASASQPKPSKPSTPQPQQKQKESTKKDKAKKQRGKAARAEKQTIEGQAKKDEGSSTAIDNPVVSDAVDDEYDGELSNDDFARAMLNIKKGAQFQRRGNSSSSQTKFVRQRSAYAGGDLSTDDVESGESSVVSPSEATDAAPIDNTGVADMLEPQGQGPSVVRVSDIPEEKLNKPAKEAPRAETKKQRQNRQKAEAAKDAVAEAERIRKAQLEEQRSTARVAEGRAAQDGSAFLAKQAEANNSWSTPLNTRSAEEPTVAASTSSAVDQSWVSGLPSEEEQLEQLKKEAEWSTVPSKAAKKSKKQQQQQMQSTPSETATPIFEEVSAVKTVPTASSGKAPSASEFGAYTALSADPDSGLVEEEWDV